MAERRSYTAEELGKKASTRAKRKVKQKAKSRAKRKFRKIHPFSYVLWILFLILGIVGGYFLSQAICEKDQFRLLGDDEIIVSVGEDFVYEDDGVRLISFGKDLSSRVTVTTDMEEIDDTTFTCDTSREGRYHIKYTVDEGRYRKVCRIRTITVKGGEE